MEHDDDDGVGYISQSHYLRSPDGQQAMALLTIPPRDGREGSFSSSVSDMDVPIYSSENLTTSSKRQPDGKKERIIVKEEQASNASATASAASKVEEGGFTGKLAFAIAASAIGASFQHGYNTGVVSNPEDILKNWTAGVIHNRTGHYPDKADVTIIWSINVSIFCLGGMIGGLLTGFVAERLGRKGGLLWNNVLVAIATICFAMAKSISSYEVLILGRFLIGINSGLNAGLSPMYLAEISPINLRGAVGTVYQLVITISILIAQVFGLRFLLGTPTLWPVLFAMTAIPAIFQVLTLPFCPESPKYLLVVKGNEIEAERALGWLRGTLAVHEEMDAMKSENDANKLMPKVTFREMITNSVLRIPLIICLTVMLAQQLSGINAVMFFSTSIFKLTGLDENGATYCTVATGLINVIMTVVSMFLVERAGRKTLLLIGFGGMVIDTSLLAMGMLLQKHWDPLKYMSVIFVFMYVILFATGPGSIPWFLVSEMFNQSARPMATSLAVGINWAANFIVGLSFTPIMDATGAYVFIIFVILQALFTVFIYYKVPETKNKPIEEITAMFRQQSYK